MKDIYWYLAKALNWWNSKVRKYIVKDSAKQVSFPKKEYDFTGVTVIGYSMFCRTCNNGHYFHKRPRYTFSCRYCHSILRRAFNPKYRALKSKGDIYATFDIYVIVSDKFKTFCDSNNYEGLNFTELPKSPGWYWFYPTIEIPIDLERSLSKRLGPCEICGSVNYYLTKNMFLNKDFHIGMDDFIYRADVEFGDDAKSPLIIVGPKTKEKLKEAGFKALSFTPIYGVY
ncbi:MAG: hypothetical protein NC127_06265 [Muribaculum sp.]|nr:hypothetical protein [Muribaculum sp.]